MEKITSAAALVDEFRSAIDSELPSRWKALDEIMKRLGLDAVLFVGNSAVGPKSYGMFRYFTNHRVYYHLQAFIARAGEAPTVICGTILHKKFFADKGFKDIRIGEAQLENVINTLLEKPVGRLGVSFEMLPAEWCEKLMQRMPATELVDITDEVFELRLMRSKLEVEATRISAQIADRGYEAVCGMIKPGVKLSDVHAELDYVLKAAGAEETFTLMSNGRFALKDNGLPCITQFCWPDDRVIKSGDSVAMEITARYMGYWSQMVRTVSVGEENPDLKRLHEAQLKIISATVPLLKPGATLGEVLTFMWEYSKELGYIPSLPFGHIVGLDLDEAGRSSITSDLELKENMTFVLHPTLLTPDIDFSIFWGQSYLVTEHGGEALSAASHELLTIK